MKSSEILPFRVPPGEVLHTRGACPMNLPYASLQGTPAREKKLARCEPACRKAAVTREDANLFL